MSVGFCELGSVLKKKAEALKACFTAESMHADKDKHFCP